MFQSRDTNEGHERQTNDSWVLKRRACAVPTGKKKRSQSETGAREGSKPRPSRAPPRDAGAHRDKALSRRYGYPRGRACVELPGRAPTGGAGACVLAESIKAEEIKAAGSA